MDQSLAKYRNALNDLDFIYSELVGELHQAQLRIKELEAMLQPKPEPVATTSHLLLGRKEAAQLLGVSLRTLDRSTTVKEIRCTRIGSRVLYSREMLQRFAQKR